MKTRRVSCSLLWLCALLISARAEAQVRAEGDDGGASAAALVFYTSTTTTGLGSTAATAVVLISSVQGKAAPTQAERKAALRIWLASAHHELDEALALGAGDALDALGWLVGWRRDERAQRAVALRARRATLRLLAQRAVYEDEALDALYEHLTAER